EGGGPNGRPDRRPLHGRRAGLGAGAHDPAARPRPVPRSSQGRRPARSLRLTLGLRPRARLARRPGSASKRPSGERAGTRPETTMEREGTAVADFSATDASLIGFRIVAERPWAVAIWAALQLAVSLTLALLTACFGAAYARLGGTMVHPAPDPSAMAQLLVQVAPSYFAQVLLSLAVCSLLFAAMDRAVLRPEERGLAWLRFGVDELRQFGLFALL